jgi:hypothetical protein
MALLFGGPKCYRKHSKGDLAIFLEWYDPERDELGVGEPCMVITRRDRFGLSGNRGSAVIMLDAAHQYADSKTGAPTRHLVQFAKAACRELSLEPSRMNAFKIADAIVEWLPDLLRMPPAPNPDKFFSRKAKPLAEVSIIDQGELVHEGEIH